MLGVAHAGIRWASTAARTTGPPASRSSSSPSATASSDVTMTPSATVWSTVATSSRVRAAAAALRSRETARRP